VVVLVVLAAGASPSPAEPEGVRGVVTDPDGRPVAGVEVELRAPGSDEPIERLVTDRAGEFSLSASEVRPGREILLHLDGFNDLALPITPQHLVVSRIELTMTRRTMVAPEVVSPPLPEESTPAPERSAPMTEQRRRAILMYNDAVEQYDKATKNKTEEDQQAAERKLREAAALDPTFPEPHLLLARLALKRQSWGEASRYAEDVLNILPDDVEASRIVYLSMVITRNHLRVTEAAERLARVNPASIPSIEEHAQTFYTNGQYEMARALYGALIEVSNDKVTAYLDLGICCRALGDSEGARTAFTSFLELAPEDHPDIAMVREWLAALE
jgi:tetratricopeptide (TPR) repeat protein